MTPYATGATIKDLVNEALIVAIRDGRDVITWPDMLKAKHLKELGPAEDVEYTERERHAIAVHEACHAVAAYRLRKHLAIDLATIEKGGDYLRLGQLDPARGPVHRAGGPSTRPTSWCPSRRWPASGCSSAATTRRASSATSPAPPRSPR